MRHLTILEGKIDWIDSSCLHQPLNHINALCYIETPVLAHISIHKSYTRTLCGSHPISIRLYYNFQIRTFEIVGNIPTIKLILMFKPNAPEDCIPQSSPKGRWCYVLCVG